MDGIVVMILSLCIGSILQCKVLECRCRLPCLYLLPPRHPHDNIASIKIQAVLRIAAGYFAVSVYHSALSVKGATLTTNTDTPELGR
ncbi:hypothetical protein F5Y17DRAFT_429078 [Xylariaceae sp. FL0594]|nr:hypothetical protein F5Y17DRAFT_429078 [Xylariaceae sp. FL0594]